MACFARFLLLGGLPIVSELWRCEFPLGASVNYGGNQDRNRRHYVGTLSPGTSFLRTPGLILGRLQYGEPSANTIEKLVFTSPQSYFSYRAHFCKKYVSSTVHLRRCEADNLKVFPNRYCCYRDHLLALGHL